MSTCPVVLFHGDFAFRNMLVDNGEVVGILDWEWCGTMPLWKEWGDVSFGDRHVYEYVPSFKYSTPIQHVAALGEHAGSVFPWQMGCWLKKGAQYTNEAEQSLRDCCCPRRRRYTPSLKKGARRAAPQ
ncbi:hypothetical protein H257_10806 [Aphanomyces astaci]|uniref:Aminoglycoside phosphotransferase domain-containing protein n=1 Tax=Aphanomyces astaci TaxID=112090 RepID=W4G4T5_APHAT|nr:hypothetical protein H257_10806 [Aphanomyces astaci]ETV74685.1 hypothetical protein H257_10806 [Aphanomyces astaci]|eukprot:XP_009835772.1 hypothetical protein H257_10806 [Aphanomyces astaci]